MQCRSQDLLDIELNGCAAIGPSISPRTRDAIVKEGIAARGADLSKAALEARRAGLNVFKIGLKTPRDRRWAKVQYCRDSLPSSSVRMLKLSPSESRACSNKHAIVVVR